MKRETLERPAFLMFAANILAKREWRSMTSSAKGLWIDMVLECWPNQEIPANPSQLAAFVHRTDSEIAIDLPAVMWFFEVRGDELFCPTMEKYRDEQDARLAKQAAGGKRGAAKTNNARKPQPAKELKHHASKPASTTQAPRRDTVGSLDQIKSSQTKTSQSLEESSSESPAYKEWMGGSDPSYDPFARAGR